MSSNQIDCNKDSIIAKKVNLAGMDQNMLRDFFTSIDEKPFRAVQVLKWIHKRGIDNFSEMTDLGKKLREKLEQIAVIEFPKVVEEKISKDGTHKWLISVSGENLIETVFIPEKKRGTLCISSQVGCPINCSFCLTAKQGFNRNLSAAEIIGQVWLAFKLVEKISHKAVPVAKVTNVVIMGMGEPLLNFKDVVIATSIMRDDNAYSLARRRVTVSTAGIVPSIEKLSKLADVALAVSLHAPSNSLRDTLVPINRKYPLESLVESCKDYVKVSKTKSVTIEYVMLKGINDSLVHAKQLVKLLNGLACKVNLIPFNSFGESDFECSNIEDIYDFNKALNKAGIVTTVRTTRGNDISAACGQLVGKVLKRSKVVNTTGFKPIRVTKEISNGQVTIGC